MPKVLQGQLRAPKRKIAIVVSRFNEIITARLLDGCLRELKKLGVPEGKIVVAWVPGALEIAVVALKFAKRQDVAAVIALGAVVRGETFHFELVAQGAVQGLVQTTLQTAKPVIMGVLSTDTLDQAYKRSDAKGDHKGREAARNALEMVNLLHQVK